MVVFQFTNWSHVFLYHLTWTSVVWVLNGQGLHLFHSLETEPLRGWVAWRWGYRTERWNQKDSLSQSNDRCDCWTFYIWCWDRHVSMRKLICSRHIVNMWQFWGISSGMCIFVQIPFPLSHTDCNFWVNIFPSKDNVHFPSKALCFGIIAVTGIESLQISRDHFNHNSLQGWKSK